MWDLSRHLVKRGYEVAVLADNFPDPPRIPIVKDGVRIYGVSKSIILKRFSSILLNLPVVYKLRKHFKSLINIIGVMQRFCCYDYVIHDFKPDVIHVHHLESRFPFAYFISKGEIPILTTVHSLSSIRLSTRKQSQRFHRLLADNLKLARDLIFVSDPLRDDWNRLFGDHKATSWVINNPIDTTKYYPIDKSKARQRIGLQNEIPIMLFVGNLRKAKGIYVLLKAVRLLRKNGEKLRLVIAGDGAERESIHDFITANDLEDVVTLEGVIQYPCLLYYYNAANLFVLPSFSEGFPLVFVEAMACGTPVIGTNIISKEIIPSDDYGLRVPVGEVKALAESIRIGVNKEWDQKRILEHARHFSWDVKIKEYERIYGGIINRQ